QGGEIHTASSLPRLAAASTPEVRRRLIVCVRMIHSRNDPAPLQSRRDSSYHQPTPVVTSNEFKREQQNLSEKTFVPPPHPPPIINPLKRHIH
ncbi:hypothetical protein FQN60_009619, partial [Etheostoma spectabile]